jgi:5'-nucleotidase
MRILLCNDDGYQALGIRTLAKHLSQAGHEISIVAPHEERSGQSHAMTFFRPVLVRQVEAQVWAVHGTPADCAAIGLLQIFQANPPDLIISGINHGLNVGWDVNYSGTVGAATEAALLGHKAIAVSVDLDAARNEEQVQAFFDRAAALTVATVERIETLPWNPLEVLNINHPGTEPKGNLCAGAGGYSMYVPNVVEMAPPANSAFGSRQKVYLLGGSRRRSNGDVTQDVTLVQNGYATFSLLHTRQNSSEGNHHLPGFLENL